MLARIITMNNLDIAIMELRGSIIDHKAVNKIKALAADLIEQGNRKLIIDLGNVTLLNSLGICSLMNVFSIYSKNNGMIKLSNMNKSIQNLFVITRLLTVFDIEDSLDEALENFGIQESMFEYG